MSRQYRRTTFGYVRLFLLYKILREQSREAGFVRALGGRGKHNTNMMRSSATELEAPRLAAKTEKRANKNVKIRLLFL